jgi:hypothetical protein
MTALDTLSGGEGDFRFASNLMPRRFTTASNLRPEPGHRRSAARERVGSELVG